MRQFGPHWGPVLVLVLALFLVAGCVPERPSDRSELIRPTISDPKSFNPIVARETSTTDVTNQMFIGLTRTNAHTGEVEPYLAKDWTRADGGRTWRFTLRDDLRWSDGEPLTVEDVVFTYRDLYLNPQVPATLRDSLVVGGDTPEVEAISDTRVEFRYDQPYAPFPRAASAPLVPKHVLEEHLGGGRFAEAWNVGVDPDELVVNGPFRLTRYRPGERLILEPNPHYFETTEDGESLPRLDRVQFEILENTDMAVQKFRLGELDAMSLQPQYYPILSPRAEQEDFSLERVGPATGTTFLGFNMNTGTDEDGNPYLEPKYQEWFNDRTFRRAVSKGINMQEIIDIVYNRVGVPIHGPMSPTQGEFAHDNLPEYGFDPERARELLAEAGYVDRDGDGYREDSEGRTVEFVIVTNTGNDQRVKMGELVRKDLSRLGLDVGFNQLNFNTLVNQLSYTYDWQAMVMGFTGGVDPHFGSSLWLSSGSLHLWHPRQPEPQREWEAEINRIFRQAVREPDRERRRELYFRWQELVNEVRPVIYLPNSEVLYAVRDRLKHVEPTVLGGIFHNLERIDVRSDS